MDAEAYNTCVWLKHRLRDADVWAKVDDNGALVTDRDGRVEVVYKAAPGAKVYRAGARNLVAVDGEKPIEIEEGTAAPAADAIHVWTDGACTGNPGPAGLGVVIVDGGKHTEISEYLGEGTNNIAELMAILRGLERVPDKARPTVVYSDSQYSIGLLTQGWKAKKNVELVEELRDVCRQFKDLRFVKVAGHAGIPLNERVDQLARDAITKRR
jgi:ribonuclease HI